MLYLCRLTCAYLSCKVDEFNVSSTQFVGNLQDSPAGQERALEQILEYELLLIQQLNFHLVVHNPYRPLEGFLIDLKVSVKPVPLQRHAIGRAAQMAPEIIGTSFLKVKQIK